MNIILKSLAIPLLVAAVCCGVLVLLSTVYGYGQEAKPPDACQVALHNLNMVQDQTKLVMGKAEALKRGAGGKKLSVLTAKYAQGFYTAMRVLLPLACKGDEYTTLDSQLQVETDALQAYVDKNW